MLRLAIFYFLAYGRMIDILSVYVELICGARN